MRSPINPIRLTLCWALVALSTIGTGPGTSSADTPDVVGFAKAGPSPKGANDWSCRPSEEHPRPVVLVHGTGMDMQNSWPVISPRLKAEGYCVFALNYGGVTSTSTSRKIAWGVSDMRQSAQELARFIDSVLARTGAGQVDVIGHSQGGVMTRLYLKFEGGADAADPGRNKVHSLVALGPPNHGTTFRGRQLYYEFLGLFGENSNQVAESALGKAGEQQLVGSELLARINSGGETEPGVQYTVIASRVDDIITPRISSFLSSANGTAENIWVQDGCPMNQVTHLGLLADPRTIFLVLRALDPSYAETHTAPCP